MKAILLDLDNTLILFDEEAFFKAYLPRITRAFSDIIPPDIFRERILSSSKALVQNDGTMSNADFFMRHFCQGFEEKRGAIWKQFMDFYEEYFHRFKSLVQLPSGVHDIMLALEKKKMKRVIASNPVWPGSVQRERMKWAGIEDAAFDFIADIENMGYCKPHLGFYRQLCEKTETVPEECLMVGNDPVNDMVAAKIGMKTYLTTDGREAGFATLVMSEAIRSLVSGDIPEPNGTGPIASLLDFIETIS